MQNDAMTLGVLAAATLWAPLAMADPVALPDQDSRFGDVSLNWFHDFIANVAGPSPVAPPMREHRTAMSRGSVEGLQFLAFAGPSHIASRGPGLTIHAGGFGDGPDDAPGAFTPVDRLGSLQPYLVSDLRIGPAAGAPKVQPSEGSFQVAVPLPGAGALAAGGLAFVAIRRRRR
ncbi:hypothetical protein AY599_07315 [Leptolyngbya valderiana BDU 20041]|nr:hypothetical protein AY599_07315 [Leptolyngbya valderiana BDU 20041]